MRYLRRLAAYVCLMLIITFLFSSCMGGSYTTNTGCRGGGGWYSNNKNLGPKNKPITYNKTYRMVRR